MVQIKHNGGGGGVVLTHGMVAFGLGWGRGQRKEVGKF